MFNRGWQCFGNHIAIGLSPNPQLVIQIHESTCGWQLFLPKLPLDFQQNACWQNKKTSWPADGNYLAKCCQTFFTKTADSTLSKESNLPVDLRMATLKLPRLPGCQKLLTKVSKQIKHFAQFCLKFCPDLLKKCLIFDSFSKKVNQG